jgi:hypothetical protein
MTTLIVRVNLHLFHCDTTRDQYCEMSKGLVDLVKDLSVRFTSHRNTFFKFPWTTIISLSFSKRLTAENFKNETISLQSYLFQYFIVSSRLSKADGENRQQNIRKISYQTFSMMQRVTFEYRENYNECQIQIKISRWILRFLDMYNQDNPKSKYLCYFTQSIMHTRKSSTITNNEHSSAYPSRTKMHKWDKH